MPTPHTSHAPNAALLIDFDNVTLGIRSDLTKELRTLLNSDIIKGKVAVQRAYADWRRYPQYIVPLSESSIDLIFAPAFGTAKKNATDIRLAVDAIELVFTRPEIGTFILLSGDSDFSSMVLKLKEYGKYVIGVGMKESASDLLIQNCDEYYSYSDLAGLSKESEHTAAPRDPWELVVEAVDKMVENRDVMRSDRLKQVMQQIDPNFDERNVGMNRFSKFVAEAAHRGLISSTKQENGQFDVGPAAGGPVTRKAAAPVAPKSTTPSASVVPAESAEGREERSGRRRRGRGGRGRGRTAEETTSSATPTADAPRAAAPTATGLTLAEAFHLMGRALNELPTPVTHESLRARMAALHGQEDVLLESARFPKLLRQANDAEVADVRQIDAEHYEVSMHKADLALQMAPRRHAPMPGSSAAAVPDADAPTVSSPTAAAAARPGGVRFRGGAKSAPIRSASLPMVGVIELNPSRATAETTPLVELEPAVKATAESTKPAPTSAKTKAAGSKPAAKAPKAAKAAKVAKSAKVAKAPAKPAAKVAAPAAKTPAKGKSAAKAKAAAPKSVKARSR